jgi:hypothetical protein
MKADKGFRSGLFIFLTRKGSSIVIIKEATLWGRPLTKTKNQNVLAGSSTSDLNNLRGMLHVHKQSQNYITK